MSKPKTPNQKAVAQPQGASPGTAAVEAPPAATALYLVGATPILCGGARFESGSTIELRPDQAARLGLSPAASADPA